MPGVVQQGAYVVGNLVSMRQTVATAVNILLPQARVVGKLYAVTDTLGVAGTDNFTIKDPVTGSTIYTLNANNASWGGYWDGIGWVTLFVR